MLGNITAKWIGWLAHIHFPRGQPRWERKESMTEGREAGNRKGRREEGRNGINKWKFVL